MRKTLVPLACAIALGVSASMAAADPIQLVIGDSYFLGTVIPGTGNPSAEQSWVNTLLSLAPDFDPDPDFTFDPGGPHQELLYRSPNAFGALPPTETYSKNDNSYQDPVSGINAQSYDYLLGKYGGAAYVWVVRDLDSVWLPWKGLSHYTLFAARQVPDGGATLVLLGAALAGLGAIRKRR
ncbi:MAG TPA: VPDSG-CTERM sorting domain-containing protein [Vicinamibacterales bacterium]|nr:VPDSG-CTERM sorting domain-containing protein [Vicinamibacterales bacterium]HPW19573.1 VPDSG-CTERM sorting domain-containing protein [Vicinamibacterales bacterium]